ncbi:hypothetical protein GCM10028812_05650 [Ancylobacter sonchi]
MLGLVAPSAAGVPTFPAIGVRPGTITLDVAPRMDRLALEPPSISRELVATGLGSAEVSGFNRFGCAAGISSSVL